MPARISLLPEAFTASERSLVSTEAADVSAFRYASGIEALRIRTDRLEVVVLPFTGQQVWRFAVDGEELAMRTMFDEPLDVPIFLQSYGNFVMHCGLTGMGHPGPSDVHPIHGELPLARYPTAFIEAGQDDRGAWLRVGGEFVHRVALATHYAFRPQLTVRPGSPLMDLSVEIENRRGSDFDYQYLCHVNFAHGAARLIQPVPTSGEHFVLYPDQDADAQTHRATDAIAADPSVSNRLSEDDHFVPEYVALTRPIPDDRGWAHYLMQRADGRAGYVGFEVAHLPYAIRWIARTADEAAAGFCLPCTSHHLGRARASAEGMLRTLPPHGRALSNIRVGLLDLEEAERTRARVEELLTRASSPA